MALGQKSRDVMGTDPRAGRAPLGCRERSLPRSSLRGAGCGGFDPWCVSGPVGTAGCLRSLGRLDLLRPARSPGLGTLRGVPALPSIPCSVTKPDSATLRPGFGCCAVPELRGVSAAFLPALGTRGHFLSCRAAGAPQGMTTTAEVSGRSSPALC